MDKYIYIYRPLYNICNVIIYNAGLHNQSVSSQKIIHHAKETLEYLKGRENFWKQQQPSHIVYTKERTRTKTVYGI